jgi:AmmeMemoRadiSam system protein B
METLWGGPETLILVSSDLSHYLDYATATRVDRRTTSAIERLDPEALDHRAACGCTPLCGLLLQARRRGLKAQTLDLRNSGDTSGTKDRVVGYGAYAFA